MALRQSQILCQGEWVLPSVWVADSFASRLRGLLGRPPLQAGEGLLLKKCNSVHTFGMRYKLDVVFLNRHGVVTSIRERLPARWGAYCLRSSDTLELAAGEVQRLGVRVGQKLEEISGN